MYAVERLSSYITRGVYTVSGPFHPFGGAVDIIVVEQQDGSFKSSPWYVRFGKFQGVLKTKEKVVNICVNGVDVGFHMYLDHKGEAYFLEESEDGEGEFATSPTSSSDENDQKPPIAKFKKAQSCDYDGGRRESVSLVEMGNGKVMSRTMSKRARLLGLMFGTRSMKEHERGGDMEMVRSLERAQIAADLLEMKWSTNLLSNDCRRDNSAEQPSERDDADTSGDKEGRLPPPSLLDDFNHDEMVDSHGEGLDDNFGTTIISTKYVEEITIHNSTQRGLSKELIIDEMRLESDEINGTLKESIPNNESKESHGDGLSDSFGVSKLNEGCLEEMSSHSSCLRDHEKLLDIHTSETCKLSDESEVSNIVMSKIDENDVESKRAILMNPAFGPCSGLLPQDRQQIVGETYGVFGEEEVASFSYYETVESTSVGFDVSFDEAHETLESGSGKCFEPNVQVLGETIDLKSELRSQEELGAFASIEYLVKGQSCHYQNLDISRVQDSSVCQNPQANCRSNGTSNEVNAFSFSTGSPHVAAAEQKVARSYSESGVTDQEEVAEDLVSAKKISIEQMELPRNQSQVNEGSREAEKSGVPMSESMEDNQLQFSENDGFGVKEIFPESLHNNAAMDTEDHPLCNLEGDLEDHDLKDDGLEQRLLSFSEVSRSETRPITIPNSKAQFSGTDQLVRSLPNIHSHIHDLETSDLQQPLSFSLNSDRKKYEKDALKKGYTSSFKLEADSRSHILHDQLTSDTAAKDDNVEEKEALFNPAIELSLCKHLLYEGMGSDAANCAFDAEKVNMEKFSALGPSIVKNDKLVVRIGGHYFPWDAAAPIILGMVSFGKNQLLEPQGMIAVDRGDKILDGDTSKTIIPSGGNWRLWPFSFKKSKTMSAIRSAPEGTNGKDADSKSIGDNKRRKSNKKMVLTPKSEQLASVNLKEGQNVVTFSFSTAMLGQQQVDARIYLWKWNTRIVISDVDGTITKSDVLGQFMPLVGVDWSQTGVAHLFSAIKDNGYQLLFLSARAISQAYLTRQFLFNLKQDGKALPDGPVVISPDGLFPSLYREVIRRAPHEFKISCLEDIRALFPRDCNPFYAGFGNRDTDEISYLKVGIPRGKIFIINPKGEVAVNRQVDTKSYSSLHALVNGMFPAMSSAEQEDFNSWNYWKLPIWDVDI